MNERFDNSISRKSSVHLGKSTMAFDHYEVDLDRDVTLVLLSYGQCDEEGTCCVDEELDTNETLLSSR
jgi:hypothetical protein